MRTERPAAMTADDRARSRTMRFQCRPGVACFNTCCRDVNIFLSPYDIVRMKNRLGMPSHTFLARHTGTLLPGPGKIPIIVLLMSEHDKRCPFVTGSGCSIYEDRPWACRMFPLDQSEKTGEYEFMVGEDRCLGRKEPVEWVIREWFTDQGLAPFEEMDERFRVVTQYPRLKEAGIDSPQVQKMFRMACYDLDTFRRFVFQTTFLKRFDIDPDTVARIRTDDLPLLDLALQWVRYGLVCGDVLPLKKAPKGSRGKGGKGKPKQRSDPS